jgi:hypothetical protein
MQNTTHLYRIRPVRQCEAPALDSAVRTYELDASFAHYGVWAGVSNLVEQAYLHYAAQGRQDVLDEHNYALYMMLPQHRGAKCFKYACQTQNPSKNEKTPNIPQDRP